MENKTVPDSVKIAFDNAFATLYNSGLSLRSQLGLLIVILEAERSKKDVVWDAIEHFDIEADRNDYNYSGSGC